MSSNIDPVSRGTTKAQKALVQTIGDLIAGDKAAEAKKVFEYASTIFDASDFSGMNEANNKGLEGVAATTGNGGLGANKYQAALKGLIRAQDILEQDGNVDAGQKVGELGKSLFGSGDFGDARKKHLTLPDQTRND